MEFYSKEEYKKAHAEKGKESAVDLDCRRYDDYHDDALHRNLLCGRG